MSYPIRNNKLIQEAYEKGYNDVVNEQYRGIPQGMGYLKQTPKADLAPHVPPAGQRANTRPPIQERGPRFPWPAHEGMKFTDRVGQRWTFRNGQWWPDDYYPGGGRGKVNEQTGGGDYQGGGSGIIKQSNRVGSGRKPQQNLNPSAASVPPEGAVPQPYPPKLYPPYTSYFVRDGMVWGDGGDWGVFPIGWYIPGDPPMWIPYPYN